MHLKVAALAIATSIVVVAFGAAPSFADGGGSGGASPGGWGTVECDQSPSPGCHLAAGWTGHQSSAPTQSPSGKGNGSNDPPTVSCAFKLTPYVPPAGAMSPPAGSSSSKGGWYVSTCSGYHFGMAGGGVFYPPVWIANGKPKAALTPAQLAEQADQELRLPTPSIELSPSGQQLVNLPTWLSLGSGSWGAQSASAAVPGVTVTATATPQSVSWSLGDGHTVTCDGPGTSYTASENPGAPSPTCGFTYRTSSAGQVGAMFTATATVRWSVIWAGAGQGGTFADLTTTSMVRVPVAESEALNTN
jgi:hypothetical protein